MLSPADTPALAAAALAIEAALGYPDWLFRRVGHPVTWIGTWLARLERALNRREAPPASRRIAGVVTLALLLGGCATLAIALIALLPRGLAGFAVAALLAASLPAQRSLDTHVRAVADALEHEGLGAGRRAVSMIVGRDPDVLDEAAVARAAIESLAESFSDGIVAPAVWLAAAGLPGGVLYKAINTADSMIGHRTERLEAFGWAAARLDDWVNLPASRLAALWLVLAAAIDNAEAGAAIRAVRRDARAHRSPNAGWPEAAMAGALGLKLGGPRIYDAAVVEDVFMGDGRFAARPADIRRALRLTRIACAIQWAVLVVLAAAVGM